jgi:hypothetical protein
MSERRRHLYRFTVRTPPLAAVLVFVALLAAVALLQGAVESDARARNQTPAQQEERHHHPTSPFEHAQAW